LLLKSSRSPKVRALQFVTVRRSCREILDGEAQVLAFLCGTSSPPPPPPENDMILLDGFPRTANQAAVLDKNVKIDIALRCAIIPFPFGQG
jgi:hypothetical protein